MKAYIEDSRLTIEKDGKYYPFSYFPSKVSKEKALSVMKKMANSDHDFASDRPNVDLKSAVAITFKDGSREDNQQ